MAKLPTSFRQRNRTTEQYRRQYASLPKHVQELVRGACTLFNEDPAHPSLRHHQLEDRKTGSHQPGSFSVSITMQYRAVYVVADDGTNIWYWIGTHAEYKRFTGSKR
jgi:hypothetical protein